jgi:hypothetical protein
MSTIPALEFVLSQNVTKQHTEVPDFTGEAHIGTALYDAAAWFREIRKGSNTGRPFVGLQLTTKSNITQKVSISLWEKQNRQSAADPHFKTHEELNGQPLNFSAWIVPAGELYGLRVVVEPFSANANDLSEAALETHAKLQDFLEQAQLSLPDAQKPELPPAQSAPQPVPATKVAGLERSAKAERDPDLDAEPDDSPFRTGIYKDVRNSQLNRRVL